MTRKTVKRIIIPIVIIIYSVEGLCQGSSRIDSIVSQWTNREMFKHTSAGVYLQDALTGEIIASTNANLSLVPASILKLFTTATALEMMGPDYRFMTTLGYSGEIRNDTLIGDLIITGGGDPALGSEHFKDHYLKPHFLSTWTDSLRRHNIRHISGNIITDATIYDDITVPGTWAWEDIGNYYGAGASGLSVYDNLFKIHFASPPEAGKPVRMVSTYPAIPGLEFDNRVVSSNIQRDKAVVFGSPFDSKRVIRGTIPKGQNNFVIKASMPDPAYLLALQFKGTLEAAGINAGGAIKAREYVSNVSDIRNMASPVTPGTMNPGNLQYPQTVLALTLSPPLIDIIREINHKSINLFAEHLLKHIAYLKTGSGSADEGASIITDFWKNKGINMEGFFMHDGSGLSRFNALTAKQMTHTLWYMKNKSIYGSLFFHSMPAVPNGTLYYFNPGNFPGNRLIAKSGSMTRVRCYAGVLRTASNREIIFTIMLNNFTSSPSQAARAIEELLLEVSRICH